MKFGEMKTAFKSVMESLEIDSSVFDFAEAIDDALYFLVSTLPPDTLAGHIQVYFADTNDTTPRQIPLPEGFLKAESIRLAKNRDTSSNPIYLPATIVSPREFVTKAQYSSEPIASMFNGLIAFNPDLADNVADKKGAVELVFRRTPRTYIRKSRDISTGILVATLDQDSGNGRLLTTETLGQSWEDLGLSTDALFGGTIIVPLTATSILTANIDYAWDDDGGVFSGIHVSEENSLPYVGATVSNCYVMESPPYLNGTETVFESDTVEPDIPKAFHHTALNYAIGKFLMSRKPEVGAAYMNVVMQTYQGLGITMKVEYGGEERV